MEYPALTHDYSATSWSDLQRPTPAWFADASFGIFIHWGPFSVPAWAEDHGELGTEEDWEAWFTHNSYAEWYYNTIRIPGSPAAARHRDLYGALPYDAFLDAWDPHRWDPASWMDLFARAGAKYTVLTTKHHDGVTLWDAPETEGRNTVARGPRRNLVEEYADAARGAGMRVGLYYSGGLDWHYRPFPPILSEEDCQDHYRPTDAGYARYCYLHCMDLIDRYRPDVLWNDINWPDSGKNFGPYGLGRLFEHFYHVCPHGVTNDRYGGVHADYLTSEYQHMAASEDATVWENCRGIGLSFGYNRAEGSEHYLSADAALRHLIDVVSRGGKLLLNVGPRADGTIPSEQVACLEGIASWQSAHPGELDGSTPLTVNARSDGWVRALRHEDHATLFVGNETSLVGELPDGFDWSRARVLAGRSEATYEAEAGRLRVSCSRDEGVQMSGPIGITAPAN